MTPPPLNLFDLPWGLRCCRQTKTKQHMLSHPEKLIRHNIPPSPPDETIASLLYAICLRWAVQSVADDLRPMILILDTVVEGQGPLGMHKDVVIDTLPPYVLGVVSSKSNGKFCLVLRI